MKQYVLFSDEELETLKNGGEIKHHISGVGELYFISNVVFRKMVKEAEEEHDFGFDIED